MKTTVELVVVALFVATTACGGTEAPSQPQWVGDRAKLAASKAEAPIDPATGIFEITGTTEPGAVVSVYDERVPGAVNSTRAACKPKTVRRA